MEINKSVCPPFFGVATAMATPFCGGKLDIPRFSAALSRQVKAGVDALCVCGTTGEAATLSPKERTLLIETAKEHAGRLPVIAGVGAADTKTAVKLTGDAVRSGADLLLVITPFCNKGTARGIFEHYRRIADAAGGCPIILYNVPTRTGVDLSVAQYNRLAAIDGVVAVKEAAERISKISALCAETPLFVYSGNDEMTLPVISVGGCGVISVLSNLVPADVSALAKAAAAGELESARALHAKYAPLVRLLFAETNPAPLKYALSRLGLDSGQMRLPLAPIEEPLMRQIASELTALELL
ncbi:MAG: 4-hydroxy-tetrahydrodipicolinate synthase [Clostridia bacterium]|nr:4-hydroxy-tetrahydrodipicolinate synthase [Clostridia bacterium]